MFRQTLRDIEALCWSDRDQVCVRECTYMKKREEAWGGVNNRYLQRNYRLLAALGFSTY